MLKEHVLPTLESRSTPVRDALRSEEIMNIFILRIDELKDVFHTYAAKQDEAARALRRAAGGARDRRLSEALGAHSPTKKAAAHSATTMNVTEFVHLMLEAGILGDGDGTLDAADNQNDSITLTAREARACFAAAQQEKDHNRHHALSAANYDRARRRRASEKKAREAAAAAANDFGVVLSARRTEEEKRRRARARKEAEKEHVAETLIFKEFIAAIVRIALAKWEVASIPLSQKVTLAVKMLCKLSPQEKARAARRESRRQSGFDGVSVVSPRDSAMMSPRDFSPPPSVPRKK